MSMSSTSNLCSILFLVTVLIFSSCSQNESTEVNQKDDEGRKHGKWVERYPDGNLKSETFYRHGIKSGTEKTFFENGNPEIIAVWEYDTTGAMLDGPYFHYYDNGQPLLRSTYIDGVPHDTVIQYYRSGIIDYRGRYDTGKTVGNWYYYDEEGTLQLLINHSEYQREYHEELRAGTYHWFDSTGNEVYRSTYMKGMEIEDTVILPETYERMLETGKIIKGRTPL